MRVCWVVAEGFSDPSTDPDTLAEIGSTWGSWRTWRAWSTDNVICNDSAKADDLIKRAFHSVCNLYIPSKEYVALGRPNGVKLYEGEFPDNIDSAEDIIGMHLVADSTDLVLLLGFDLTAPESTDPYEIHKRKHYLSAFKGAVTQYPQTQWVLINDPDQMNSAFEQPDNLSCDTYENVLQLLG